MPVNIYDELTIIQNPIMETQTPNILGDQSSTKIGSGHLYGFIILDSQNGQMMTIQDSRESSPSEYFFTVPPKSITITEPATVQIQPTIGHGYLIEHQGSLLKQLSVSGTTGFRPMSTSAQSRSAVYGVDRLFNRTIETVNRIASAGEALLGATDARGLNPSEKSGYFNFVQLRNVFRRYFALKSNPEDVTVARPILVWVNFHEFEFWVCEPESFTTRRDSSSPLTFSYDISCTILNKLAANMLEGVPPDWLALHINAGDYIGAVFKAITDLNRVVQQTTQVPGAIAGDLIGITNRAIDSMREFAFSVGNIVRLGNNIGSIPEWIGRNVVNQWLDLVTQWDVATSNETDLRSQYNSFELGNNFAEGVRAINRLISLKRDRLANRSNSGTSIRTSQLAYGSSRRNQNTGFGSDAASFPKNRNINFGDPLDIRNAQSFGDSTTSRILAGEDIRAVALRTLGADGRWKELVILNELRAPYIAAVASEGVLAYGDVILIPKSRRRNRRDANLVLLNSFGGTVQQIQPEDVIFGKDILVVSTGNADMGQAMLDFGTTPGGDLATVSGIPNFEQAMFLVLNTERKSLKAHPSYGMMRLTGTRTTHATATVWAMEIERTISADPRVESITDVGVSISGDILIGNISVIGQESLAKIPITTVQAI